jgi:hypothetical protein
MWQPPATYHFRVTDDGQKTADQWAEEIAVARG